MVAPVEPNSGTGTVSTGGIPSGHAAPRDTSPNYLAVVYALLPGVLLSAAIALSALWLRQLPMISVLSPMILSIIIGIGFHNLVGTPRIAKPGVVFSMRRLLRFAIVLLGLQLTAAQIAEVGLSGLAVIVLALVATFIFTVRIGKLMGVEPRLAELIAAGTSICGASAVIATNTVTRASDEDAAYAVACVTVFGSIAMFLYPMVPPLLGLGPQAYGLWVGSSIHEVSQVVAAAYQGGQEAGDFGTVAKLSRVIMLAPVVLFLGALAARRVRLQGGEGSNTAHPPVPWFVFGFLAMVVFNSLVAIPPEVKSWIMFATTFMLSMALAAIGLEINISKLRAKGMRPFMLGLVASLFIAGLSLGLVILTT